MSDYEKYIVIRPSLLKRIIKLATTKNSKSVADKKPATPLDRQLLNVMNNKKIGAATKWLMYKDILTKFTKPDILIQSAHKKPAATKDKKDKKEQMNTSAEKNIVDIGTQTEKRRPKDSAMQTDTTQAVDSSVQTDPSRLYDDVYESNPQEQPEPQTEREVTDYALEEFLKQMAAEEAGVDARRLVRRPNVNDSRYAVFDDTETNEVLYVDVDDAKKELYKSESPPPKSKRFSPSKVKELRSRSILKKDKYLNKHGNWSTL